MLIRFSITCTKFMPTSINLKGPHVNLYVVFYGLKQQPWETPPSRKSELVQAFTIQVYLDLLVGEVIVG